MLLDILAREGVDFNVSLRVTSNILNDPKSMQWLIDNPDVRRQAVNNAKDRAWD